METRIITKYGIPVYLRELPSGDLQVWHGFNHRVREIVEGACRGRGRWDSVHNNWTVFSQFRKRVIAEIEGGM